MKERKLQEISYLKFGKELGTELVRVVQESTENLAICKDVSMLQLIPLQAETCYISKKKWSKGVLARDKVVKVGFAQEHPEIV